MGEEEEEDEGHELRFLTPKNCNESEGDEGLSDLKKNEDMKKVSSFPCKYCEQEFRTVRLRREHWLSEHLAQLKEQGLLFNHNNRVSIKNFHCDAENCTRAFRHCCEKDDHMAAVHRGEKNYVCEICSRAFPYRKSLKSHMEVVHGVGRKPDEEILCTECGEVFTSKYKLQVHKVCVHKVKVKKFLCKFCDFKTHAKNVITEHERTHTGEKPEICAWCGKGFSQKKTLKNHERLHTGEKPYKCKFCENRFAQRTSLNVHLQSHHKDRVPPKQIPVMSSMSISDQDDGQH